MTFAPKLDLGVVVDEEDQAVSTYQSEVFALRAEGWGRFGLDVELLNCRLQIWGRASVAADSAFSNVTDVFWDLAQPRLDGSGYYEIVKQTMVAEIQFRWETLDPDNRTKVAVLLGRPDGLRGERKRRVP